MEIPASLIFLAVPPDPNNLTPASLKPLANSRRSDLSYTDKRAFDPDREHAFAILSASDSPIGVDIAFSSSGSKDQNMDFDAGWRGDT